MGRARREEGGVDVPLRVGCELPRWWGEDDGGYARSGIRLDGGEKLVDCVRLVDREPHRELLREPLLLLEIALGLLRALAPLLDLVDHILRR